MLKNHTGGFDFHITRIIKPDWMPASFNPAFIWIKWQENAKPPYGLGA